MIQSPQWKLLGGEIDDNKSIDYLPIEALRGQGATGFFCGVSSVRTFRSSGTTDKDRSTSLFSREGLELYRERSLAQFSYVLDQVLPPQGDASRLGLSLIPDSDAWPDSSLAQMLTWISEAFELKFVSEAELKSAISSNKNRRLWIFGTAFHWVNALDSGATQLLPPGSVIFETGGTKGRSREIKREDLYLELSEAFGIPSEAIVSEYGMCELACQAYDFVPHGQKLDLELRRFRFYHDVELAVLDRPGSARSHGRGGLMVRDPARVDYPWFVRTEDLAEISDGSFKLLGRTPKAPLKGCSLGAEKVLGNDQRVNGPTHDRSICTDSPSGLCPNLIDQRIKLIADFLNDFLVSERALATFAAELGSTKAAASALADVKSGIPDSRSRWDSAISAALGRNRNQAAKWLFILPENHSLVGLYPLSIAYAAGLAVSVRLPKAFEQSGSLISVFLSEVKKLAGAVIDVLPSHWRIGDHTEMPPVDAILCYGSSETVKKIQSFTNLPVRGFGHRIPVTVVPINEIRDSSDKIAADCLSLGQLGCMSSRAIFVVHDGTEPCSLDDLLGSLQLSGREFWATPIPWQKLVSLDAEAFRYTTLGAKIRLPDSAASPLVCWSEMKPSPKFGEFDALLSRTQFCLPVVSCAAKDLQSFVLSLSKHLKYMENIGTITVPHNQVSEIGDALSRHGLPGASIRGLGQANAPKWDGYHEGLSLFDLQDYRLIL